MVICLERGADDLYMVELMPLPPRHLLVYLSGAGLPRLSLKKGRYACVFVFNCIIIPAMLPCHTMFHSTTLALPVSSNHLLTVRVDVLGQAVKNCFQYSLLAMCNPSL